MDAQASTACASSISYENMKKKGFTLTELLIVIVVIGVLATLGISQFFVSRERAIVREGVANLNLVMSAARVVRMERGAFNPSAICGNTNACNTALRLSMNGANWTYSTVVMSCPGQPANADLRAWAVRTASWGGGTCTLLIESCPAGAFTVPTPAPGAVCAQ